MFRLLNDPRVPVLPQEFHVKEKSQIPSSTQIIRSALPKGVTPLIDHIETIHGRVAEIAGALASKGQAAVIVIATDGLPTDHAGTTTNDIRRAFVQSLQRLQSLPVWIVIRLCTDDREVVDFYNSLDSELEMSLEVLDDFLSEVAEVRRVNPWLNYTMPLHRIREMGYQHRVFDLLDERPLNKDELVEFLKIVFVPGTDLLPNIHVDFAAFEKALSQIVQQPKEWNFLTKKHEPWINMKSLRRVYRPASVGCFCSR